MLPVYRGEIAGRCLGVDTAAFDLDGNEVVGELGELVIRQPMPSMPVRFWGDEDGERYRARTSTCTPASGARATGCASPSRARASSPAARTRRSTAAASGWGRASSTPSSRRSPRSQDSLVVHLEDDEGGPGSWCCSSSPTSTTSCGADRGRAALAALAAPRAGHDRRRPGDPAHADRQEARGAGQADPARRARPSRSPAAARSRSRARSMRSCSSVRRGGEDDGRPAGAGAAADRQRGRCPTAAAILRSEMALEPYEASLGVLLRRWAEEAPDRVFLAERPRPTATGSS